MVGYRVKQFYSGLVAKVDDQDVIFLRTYLSEEEIQLFYKLAVYEQKHCVRVAREVKKLQEEQNIKSDLLVKAAILHDIGKVENRLNIFEKSLLVVLHKLTNGKMRFMSKSKAVDTFYNHPDKGYEVLKKYGYDEKLLYLIKNHHNYSIYGDKELNILIKSDNNN